MVVDLKKPLLRCTKMKLEDEMFWVDFQYESLPLLCFYYRTLGHVEKSCERKMKDSQEAKICEGQYGNWIRAKGRLVGRKEHSSDSLFRKKWSLARR